MQTRLSQEFTGTRDGEQAAGLIKKCVHCGFCNATCPTFQLLGDELDGPRGRIYLIKQVLEGGGVTRSTQQHLDRCLTCLNCETTCPSGVQYGQIVAIGRKLVERKVHRPPGEAALRWLLKEGLTSRWFAPALRMGRALQPFLPPILRRNLSARQAAVRPAKPAGAAAPPAAPFTKVLLLRGCVQPALSPNIDRAAIRVMQAAGIEVLQAQGTGCCGALRAHLSDHDGGLRDMRRNVTAWLPLIDSGEVSAIVSSASACALTIKEYGRALVGEPEYAAAGARVSALARDLGELLPQLLGVLKDRIRPRSMRRLAYHPPCTLQHGQRLHGLVENCLRSAGFEVSLPADSHLCCGSAGTYSLLQPQIARQLRDRKLEQLDLLRSQCIVSANIGCIQHLQSGSRTPVKHWVELLDEALNSA